MTVADDGAPTSHGNWTGSQTGGYPYGGQYQEYGILPPLQGDVIQGSGGHPSPGAGLISGFQSGMNIGSQIVGAHRATQQYKEAQRQQALEGNKPLQAALTGTQNLSPQLKAQYEAEIARNNARAGVNAQGIPLPGGFSNFLHSMADGVQHLLGGGPSQQGGAQAAPAQAAPAGPDPAKVSPSAQAAQASLAGQQDGMAYGGVVPDSMSPHIATGDGGMVVPRAGSQVNGVYREAPPAPKNFYDAGGGVLADGTPTMLAAPQDAGAPAQGLPPPMPAPQGDVSQAPQGGDPVSQAFEAAGAHLYNHALNDKGVPNGQQGIAADPQQAAQQVAQNPAAQAGIPEQPPAKGQAHSLSPEWYDKMDFLSAQAASAASAAGHDGGQVYAAMQHMTTSFIQTHIMREASSAAAAFQNGNMKAVEQSLKNMNYYVPNGQDLTVKKDAQGNMVYQNPIFPYKDKDGNPTDVPGPDATPNMQPVDAEHLSFLANAAADPMSIQKMITDTRMAYAKSKAEGMTAQGILAKGQGTLASGQAAYRRAENDSARIGSENLRDQSDAYLNYAKANSQKLIMRLMGGKLDPQIERNVLASSAAVDAMVLGPPKTVPVNDTNADGTPGALSLSPAAGKTIHDDARGDKALKGISGNDYTWLKATAAGFSGTGMPAQQAAALARDAYVARGQSHTATGDPYAAAYLKAHPELKGKMPNFVVDPQSGAAHFWNGKSWDQHQMRPEAANVVGSTAQLNLYMQALNMGGGQSPQGAAAAPAETDQTAQLAAGDSNAPGS